MRRLKKKRVRLLWAIVIAAVSLLLQRGEVSRSVTVHQPEVCRRNTAEDQKIFRKSTSEDQMTSQKSVENDRQILTWWGTLYPEFCGQPPYDDGGGKEKKIVYKFWIVDFIGKITHSHGKTGN